MKNFAFLLVLGLWAGGAATPSIARVPSAALPTPRYDVRGVFDPGMNGLIAYALKVPHGWPLQQSFTRQWVNAYPINIIYLGTSSPDGHTVIEFLPELSYHYGTGPTAIRMQQQMEQYSHQHDDTWQAPLMPVAYLKQVFLPLLTKQTKLRPRITGEHETPAKMIGQNVQAATGYLDCVLPSGRKMRISTALHVLTGQGADGPIFNWGGATEVVQSDTDLPGALATAAIIEKSIAPNPAWQSKDQALRDQGQQQNQQQTMANLAASQQRFEQNVKSQQARSAAINNNFHNQQRASSQVASAYADFMGDKTLYQNADGERVKVPGNQTNVYQDAQGTVLSTNAPLSGSHVNWQELQQVEVKNY